MSYYFCFFKQVFPGTFDSYWHYPSVLPRPVTADTFRIIPEKIFGSGLGLRFELGGCKLTSVPENMGKELFLKYMKDQTKLTLWITNDPSRKTVDPTGMAHYILLSLAVLKDC